MDENRLIYITKTFPRFAEAIRAALIGRRVRPDIWWYATNKDGDWAVVGYHISPDEFRPGQVAPTL